MRIKVAKIHEEVIVVKVSKLIKNDDDATALINDDVVTALEQVAQELLGDSVIVEVEQE